MKQRHTCAQTSSSSEPIDGLAVTQRRLLPSARATSWRARLSPVQTKSLQRNRFREGISSARRHAKRGVGRESQALAGKFKEVLPTDYSASQRKEEVIAEEMIRKRVVNLRKRLLTSRRLQHEHTGVYHPRIVAELPPTSVRGGRARGVYSPSVLLVGGRACHRALFRALFTGRAPCRRCTACVLAVKHDSGLGILFGGIRMLCDSIRRGYGDQPPLTPVAALERRGKTSEGGATAMHRVRRGGAPGRLGGDG